MLKKIVVQTRVYREQMRHQLFDKEKYRRWKYNDS